MANDSEAQSEQASAEIAAIDLPEIGDRSRYDALMQVIRNRITSRACDPDFTVPTEHYDLILDAARHAPSGANAQPWHFITVTEPKTKLPPF